MSNNKLECQIPVGGQMDTMNDSNSYANNSGLCGMPTEQPPVKLPETDDSWFSWQGAGIGYSVGFFAIIAIILFTECIGKLPSPRRSY
ncbi:hypothetical protein Peur_056328 [Populus x canadensis]